MTDPQDPRSPSPNNPPSPWQQPEAPQSSEPGSGSQPQGSQPQGSQPQGSQPQAPAGPQRIDPYRAGLHQPSPYGGSPQQSTDSWQFQAASQSASYGHSSGAGHSQPSERSQPVTTAFLLILIGAAVAILGSIAVLPVREELFGAMEMPQFGPAVEDLDIDLAALAGVVSLVFTIVVAGLFVGFGFAMRGGANWARILLTVLTGIGILFYLADLPALPLYFSLGAAGAVQGLETLIMLPLAIMLIVMMFRPEANRYFRPV